MSYSKGSIKGGREREERGGSRYSLDIFEQDGMKQIYPELGLGHRHDIHVELDESRLERLVEDRCVFIVDPKYDEHRKHLTTYILGALV